MRPHRVLLAGLLLPGGGCFAARPSATGSFAHLAARNAVQQPVRHHDDKEFVRFVRSRAEAAWDDLCAAGPRHRFHPRPYREGFVEGFVDYVEAGGPGEPPYLPPLRYRLTRHRTAGGVTAADEWYAGFRHGSAVARGSGLRELNYVPLPGPATPAGDRTPGFDGPPADVAAGYARPAEAPQGVLPGPRVLPADPAPAPTPAAPVVPAAPPPRARPAGLPAPPPLPEVPPGGARRPLPPPPAVGR